jgi:hypothetical protein
MNEVVVITGAWGQLAPAAWDRDERWFLLTLTRSSWSEKGSY